MPNVAESNDAERVAAGIVREGSGVLVCISEGGGGEAGGSRAPFFCCQCSFECRDEKRGWRGTS